MANEPTPTTEGWVPHYGASHPFAKLNDDAVREIRRLHADEGLSYNEIGRRFGVSGQTVRLIVLRRTWRHVQ